MAATDASPGQSVLVCQNITCRHQGSKQVLEAFQTSSPSQIVVRGCGCLGHCGNGPTVLILPDETWYEHVQPETVSRIVEQHFSPNRTFRDRFEQKLVAARENAGALKWALVGLGLFISGAIAGTVWLMAWYGTPHLD